MKYAHISSQLTNNLFDKSQPVSEGRSTNTPEIKTHETLDNTNELTTPTLKTSTPHSSSTQRELKKLDDCWQRNNPVHEDSPRLRSNGQIMYGVKDCFGEGKRVNRSKNGENKTKESNTNDEGCLPESPIPNCNRNPNEKDITSPKNILPYKHEVENSVTDDNTRANNTTNIGSPNIFNKLPRCYPDAQQSVSPDTKIGGINRCSPALKCNTKQPETLGNVSIPDMSVPNSVAESSRLCNPCSNMKQDANDSFDEYYIPPRKKLRSEVAQDELWDGIPLTVSFKRLAPNVEGRTHVSHNIHADSKAYEENEEKHQKEIYNIANEASTTTELPTVSVTSYENRGKYTTIKDVQNNKATPMSIKRKPARTIMETKRSARLIEKSSETPSKKELKCDSVSEDNAFPTHSLHNSTELNVRNESFTMKETLTITNGNAIDGFETSSEELRDLAAGGQSNDNLHPITLSNIPSYESKNGVFGAKENDKLVLKQCVKDIDTDSPVTIEMNSISNTLNSLFEEHTERILSRKRPLNEMSDDDVRTIQNKSITMMRSEGLEIEKRKSSQNSPDIPAIDNNEAIPDISVTESNTSTEESDSNTTKETSDIQTVVAVSAVSALSKHKLFSSNTCTKIPKRVPPLRIKLKYPLKNAQKKSNRSKTKPEIESVDNDKSPKASKLKHKTNVSDSEVETSTYVTEERASSADKTKPSTSRTSTCTKQRNTSTKTGTTPKIPKEKKPKKRKWYVMY